MELLDFFQTFSFKLILYVNFISYNFAEFLFKYIL